MTVQSDMWSLLFRNNLAPDYQWKEPGRPEAAETLSLGMEMHGAGWCEGKQLPAEGWKCIQTIFRRFGLHNIHRVFPIGLWFLKSLWLKEKKSKPNLSNFSGLTSPSAA